MRRRPRRTTATAAARAAGGGDGGVATPGRCRPWPKSAAPRAAAV